MWTLKLVFWLSATLLIYIYAGYPLLVWLGSRRRRAAAGSVHLPATVSVVLVAHNEQQTIRRKLRQLFTVEEQARIIEVLVGSDGSTDATVDEVQAVHDPRIHLIAWDQRRGKPAVLNELIPRCRGEVVWLLDARQELDRAVLSRLLHAIADPTVGVVSGELIFRTGPQHTPCSSGLGWYWRYEKFLRKAESNFRGVPGATGACYLLRRELFCPIPENTLLDDVAIPMLIAAQGKRCRLQEAAWVLDEPSRAPSQEAIRKRRTIAGVAQLVQMFPHWCLPGGHPLWWEFLSHKVLRLASPGALVLMLGSSLALWSQPVYRVLAVSQLACYAAAGCGWWFQRTGHPARILGIPLMFLTLNLTTFLALVDAWRGNYRVTWRKV
ncbi:MAG: glycosyl transferase [Planctomycetaceae bacterium]|nr:MAG: glycosyl transferase [Planctomycetaceae bacterium]